MGMLVLQLGVKDRIEKKYRWNDEAGSFTPVGGGVANAFLDGSSKSTQQDLKMEHIVVLRLSTSMDEAASSIPICSSV